MDTFKDYYDDLEPDKTAVIAYGRFNPPSIGHALLIDKVDQVTNRTSGADGFIVPTHTTGNAKNPLNIDEKIAVLNEMLGDTKRVQTFNGGKHLIATLQSLEEQGYDNIIHIAGSDRIPEFEKLVGAYNGKPDKKGNIPFTFKNYTMESAGERDPDSDDVSGMSASKLRAIAIEGDLEAFKAGMAPSVDDNTKEKVFNIIRERTK